jgi:hypothetical protein
MAFEVEERFQQRKGLVMKRQRMYLFERAYVDYATRLQDFRRALWRTCSNIWTCFWSGPGSTAIEYILRIAIVITVIGLDVLYVRDQQARGLSVSFDTVLVILVIDVFAFIVLLGWKPVLHFAARVVSGAAASGLILVLAVLAIVLAMLVFLPYLLVLFALTALSFVVFLPMRVAHSIWLLYRRIVYRCPYDDCSHSGLPIHICPCGHQYDDLQPSFYGIFYHTCRHSDGTEVKLPTMDFLGRNKLSRLCGRCKRPLVHSSLGELPEWPIVVVGGANTGKTLLLLQATRRLQQQLGALPGGTVRIDSEEQKHIYQRQIEQLDRGGVVGKTAGGTATAFGLAVRIPKRLRCLLYLFDRPGEDFATMQRFGQMQVIQHLKGILLLVDPFSLPMLYDYVHRLGDGLAPSEESFERVVHNLINGVNLMLVRQPTDRCDVPLAVVMSKADALPTEDFSFLANLFPGEERTADDLLHARGRQALERLGGGRGIHLLERKFSRVQYFVCTALGRMPDPHDTSPFQPVGVTNPFLWLVGLDRSDRS